MICLLAGGRRQVQAARQEHLESIRSARPSTALLAWADRQSFKGHYSASSASSFPVTPLILPYNIVPPLLRLTRNISSAAAAPFS